MQARQGTDVASRLHLYQNIQNKSTMDALHDLPDKVLATYEACIKSGEVKYYPSEVNVEDNELKVRSSILNYPDAPSLMRSVYAPDRDPTLRIAV
jgi:hypothetical protein